MTATQASQESPKHEHGGLYWFVANSWKKIRFHYEKHKFVLFMWALVAFLTLYVLRAMIQPWVLFVRIYSFEIALVVLSLWILKRIKHRLRWKAWLAILVLTGIVISMSALSWTPHAYLSSYLCYRAFDREYISVLPETDHERIQPLGSIRVIANQVTTDNVQPTEPYNVRVNGEYHWTMGIEPSYPWGRLTGGVDEVISIPATSASPKFSKENRHPVSFSTGEQLYLGKNTTVCATRSFGLIRFLSYEPGDVKYLKNDQGEWVQVVSLIKWEGFFFPQPVFGGVQVISQSKGGILHFLKTVLVGDGTFVSAEDIGQHTYLRGQNLVPYKVSRNMAESMRFHKGFLAPFWGYHREDLCIPDLPGDQNDQPFTTYFKFDDGSGKLYHYFALEPYQQDKRGLSLSLLVPADGIGATLVSDHGSRKETMIGVSAVAAQVKSSKKTFDWEHNIPAENRPYVRTIDGKRRFFWLTTIMTKGNKNSYETGEYVAGATPDVALTDPVNLMPVWVDSRHPETWVPQLKRELGSIWDAN